MSDSISGLPSSLQGLELKQTEKAGSSNGLEQDQFLELMMAQLKNQDPLKPMESGEFLGQLAQFGTVNGINDLQNSVQSLASALQSNQALQASTMVGRNVLVESDIADMSSDSALKGAVDLPASSGHVGLTIKDASGQVVRQLSLGGHEAGLVQFSWDGLDDAGSHVAGGIYQVSADYAGTDGNFAASTLVQAQVESVTLQKDGSSPKLNLGELGSVTIDNVRQVL